ncbi:tRNA (5-methylaminomethyl-2-thiouridine)(34)-methyltransferase MnmC2 [Viscerimonas tarda]
MNTDRHITCTADGSHTLYIPGIDEHYHSVNGAIQESTQVFINAGLQQLSLEKTAVLEVGFGAGLNAYLTALYAGRLAKKISYTAFELYPLEADLIKQLNYPFIHSAGNAGLFDKIHAADWNKAVFIEPHFCLKKILADINDFAGLTEDETFDLVYYDAFSPDKQPEMWTQAIFDYLHKHTNSGGLLVTYCAKGVVRRMLQTAGFVVERLPGPPGKREMLRASKI